MKINTIAQLEVLKRQETLLVPAPRLAEQFGLDIELRIKRDDLYPLAGGGTKGRKIVYLAKDAIVRGYDVLVTNGGPQSNHARATAVIAASLGLKCHLVIVLEPETDYSLSGNILLMKLSGASIEFCEKNQLSDFMDRAIAELTAQGYKPLYIWGGGNNVHGTIAFIDAAAEAQNQCRDWIPDYLVLASGTGSTQAGLVIGYSNLPTKVIGVSIAREKERGTRIIQECIDECLAVKNLPISQKDVIFRDDWIDGGYERYSPDLLTLIEQAAKCGYFFDPTYSGKAFHGLVSMVATSEIEPESKVLFWHTGGLMNLQAILHYTKGLFRL